MANEIDVRRLALLYKKVGIDTSDALITKRTAGLSTLIDKSSSLDVCVLAQISLGVNVPSAALDTFVAAFSNNDAAAALRAEDRETALLAGALLHEVLQKRKGPYAPAALALSCGSFGGVRKVEIDPELTELAGSVVFELQQKTPPAFPPLKFPKKLETAAVVAQATQLNGQNQFNQAIATMLPALAALGENVNDTNRQLGAYLTAMEQQLRSGLEEMQLQWWVFGGWSRSLRKPYASLVGAAAAILAAKELLDLSTSVAGPTSSAALLDLVLARASEPRTFKFRDAITSAPRDWRKSWCTAPPKTSAAKLCPVYLALYLATDSGDAPDWVPRFERESGVDSNLELNALDLSNQLFLELLLQRSVQ